VITIAITIDELTLKQVKAIEETEERSRSEIVREAIRQYLEARLKAREEEREREIFRRLRKKIRRQSEALIREQARL
jgi:metal-responsive CopG/Arc/MetJ family transcriptional regulator